MKRSMACSLGIAFAAALIASVGCSDDDNPVEVPVDQVVEAGINDALTTTVVPVVRFMGAVGDLLTARNAVAGFVCPDTTGWCSAGTVACTPNGNALDFDFDQCAVVTGDAPLTLDGIVSVVPTSTIFLTFANLFINDSPSITGTGSINVSECDYTIDVSTDNAYINGLVTQCDSDPYPITGSVVNISFGDYLVTISPNGTSSAPATASQGKNIVATCAINLDTFTSACDAL